MVPNGIRFYRFKLKERGTKRWSQDAVSEAAGIGRTDLSLMENGRFLPTPAQVKAMADYLEVTPGHLFTVKQLDAIFEMAEEGGE